MGGSWIWQHGYLVKGKLTQFYFFMFVFFSANVQFSFFTSASLKCREVVALLFYHPLHSKCFNSVMG